MESKDKRVKFNEKLEEYEPGTVIDDFFEVVDCDEDKLKFHDIKEEEAEDDATIQEVEELLLGEIVDSVIQKLESDNEIDEICEEIDDMGFGTKVRPKSASGIRDEPVVSSDETEKEQEPEEEATDEEDLLSTLVASYVPENIPTPVKKPPKEKPPPAKSKKPSCFNFGCRKSPNRVSVSKSSPTLSLKLNYKTCCEYRNAENQRLPKYMGYLSEYGLTKEQLDAREKKIKVKKNKVMEKNLNATKAQIDKMCDNEAAFTTWLKNKMRFPVNKTVNMFDYKGSIKQNKITSFCEKQGKKAKSAGQLRGRREKSAFLLSV